MLPVLLGIACVILMLLMKSLQLGASATAQAAMQRGPTICCASGRHRARIEMESTG